MDKSPRPKAKPMTSSPRPKARPEGLKEEADLMRAMGNAQKRERADANAAKKMAKGGKISEYGGKEKYKSKSAMMKHEGKESKATERKERKMAGGGMCRGMGAAKKGGSYSKAG